MLFNDYKIKRRGEKDRISYIGAITDRSGTCKAETEAYRIITCGYAAFKRGFISFL